MIDKINSNKIDTNILNEAVAVLKTGGVIIYPTDTAYGLGCDATNEKAVEKIYEIKKRMKTKSMPVIVGSFDMAQDFFLLNKKERELGEKFWDQHTPCLLPAQAGRRQEAGGRKEAGRRQAGRLAPLFRGEFEKGIMEKGKLSIVLRIKKNTTIASSVLASDNTVATRAPNSLWARNLSLKLGNPIVSTSANLSGTASCYSINEIKKTGVEYKNIDLILDAGVLPRVPVSTIVRVKNGKVEILREGSVNLNLNFKSIRQAMSLPRACRGDNL